MGLVYTPTALTSLLECLGLGHGPAMWSKRREKAMNGAPPSSPLFGRCPQVG